MIEQAVYQLLATAAPVTDKVGDRIHYRERLQAGELPAIVIERGDAAETHHLKGRSKRVSGFIRVTCLASSYLAAGDLTRKVRDRLDAFTGTVDIKDEDGQTITLRVRYLLHDGEGDVPSDHRDGQGSILTHGIVTDYRFAFTDPS